MTDEQRLYMGIYRTYLVVQRDHTLPPKLHARVMEFIHGNLIEAGRWGDEHRYPRRQIRNLENDAERKLTNDRIGWSEALAFALPGALILTYHSD